MNRPSLTGWPPFGFMGLLVLAVAGLPLVSATASLGEKSWWTSFGPSSHQSQGPSVGDVAAMDDQGEPGRADQSPSASAQQQDSTQTEAELRAARAAAARYCELGARGLDRAREYVHYQRLEQADELLTALLSGDCLEASEQRDLARFQHAYVLQRLERPDQVLQRLDSLEEPAPVEDYVQWLRGEAFSTLDRHAEAAMAFGAIYDAGDSPLHWQALARQGKSLVDAEQWEAAHPIVEDIIDRFPDYPRRHRALYDHGRILEQLGNLDEAALAYQKAHFEFPYKREGEAAKERLQILADAGHVPEPIDPKKRYAQYRQLSIDKFWPLAHELLTELRDEVSTPEGNSEFENEILQRIALNTYHSHDFEGAAQYFQKAREIIEDGHERGFNKRVIYRYLSFALGRLGRYDESLEALEKLHENSSRRARNSSIGLYYERYGRYEEAYDTYKEIYSAHQQRGWHFSYLTYKSGQFEEAYEKFQRLARRSRGETRARYLYWAGRSLERGGNEEEAAELFAELAQSRPNSYYGIQGMNRLIDLRQRAPADGTFLAQADRLGDSADQVLNAFDGATQISGTRAVALDADPRTQPIPASQNNSTNSETNGESLGELIDQYCEPHRPCRAALMRLPAYGLTWRVGHTEITRSSLGLPSDDEIEPIEGLDYEDAPEIRVPRRGVEFPGEQVPRINFDRDARIYWNGRNASDIAFIDYSRGEMIGPVPGQWTAYDDDTHHGGLERAIDEAGELFPQLERAYWLRMAGWYTEARRVIRDVSLEYRSLATRSRARTSPHELPQRRWAYLIDNRRRAQRADWWGMSSDEKRFPVPEDRQARQELLERQQEIFDRRRELRPIIVEALQEVGDYHLVRRFALDDTWWLRQDPEGDARRYWAMAYPRAFPEQVIPLAKKHNINPYLIWSLMLVESSFNPDSISIADALGLLQVIPRTGLKIADLFGAEDFGPFDLLEADNSIEQGIFYFSRLVQKFEGQELLAFAGYNGGPHRVGGWLDMRGHNIPLDEFIEEIPFNESRGYAKKVLRFLHVYLRIYEGYDDGIYVGQVVNPDYLPQPDF